ncbi:unnamed protein product, partial [Mesorhabditis belari]|uniref:Uncharacterized protein n=1 Tax=Mesorhabditis belari TaxID=2138241 RepID=A0AAF3F805_9BILA
MKSLFVIALLLPIVAAQAPTEPEITEEAKQKIAQEENALSPEKTFVNRVKEAFEKNKGENSALNKEQVEAEVDQIRSLESNPRELESNPEFEIAEFEKDMSSALEADPNMGETLKQAREMAEKTVNRRKRQDTTQQHHEFKKPTDAQMAAINQEIAQLQQTNPEVASWPLRRNDTMTPKEKMGKLVEWIPLK